MNSRPKIKLELTVADKIIETLGWISVLAIWILSIMSYNDLPDTIPIHYNSSGQADRFGGKGYILIFALIATVIFMALSCVIKFPHKFNYPIKITADNALSKYSPATRLLRYIKLIVVVIFGIIVFRTMQVASGQANDLGEWFLPLAIGLLFLPTIYFLAKTIRSENKK